MTLFWVVAGLLTIGALMFIAIPLIKGGRNVVPESRKEINLDIMRDQMRELDADLEAKTLSDVQYQQAKDELERRVLENTATTEDAGSPPSSGRWILIFAVVAIPLLAISIYMLLGKPEGVNPQDKPSPNVTQEQIEQMVVKLAQKLKNNPDDAQGWEMLARSYATLRRFEDSRNAYAKAAKLSPNNAKLLIEYADVLAMTQGRNVVGEAEEIVNRALALEPENLKGLALAATAAFQRKDYRRAVELWQKALTLVPADSPAARSINANLSQVQGLTGMPIEAPAGNQPSQAGAKSVKGRVSMDAKFKSTTSKSETVFIFARDADSQRPPLAIIRKKVGDLPFEFTLDDSMAVMPNFRLSSAKHVVVGARISKSGGAAAQAGDIEGVSQPVNVGSQGVNIVIAREVK